MRPRKRYWHSQQRKVMKDKTFAPPLAYYRVLAVRELECAKLWKKLAKSKKYREEFVAAQVKRGIPFQIRTMLKSSGVSQEEIAARAGITQGVLSRAANPNYGNLTLNTIIRIAAGFDVAFIGKFVPFSELSQWFTTLSEDAVRVKTFSEEREALNE